MCRAGPKMYTVSKCRFGWERLNELWVVEDLQTGILMLPKDLRLNKWIGLDILDAKFFDHCGCTGMS